MDGVGVGMGGALISSNTEALEPLGALHLGSSSVSKRWAGLLACAFWVSYSKKANMVSMKTKCHSIPEKKHYLKTPRKIPDDGLLRSVR